MSANVLTASELLSRAALKTAPVEIDGGGRVFVRELSVAQRSQFVERARNDPASLAAWLVTETCCDEAGVRLFVADDASKLAESSPRIVDAIGTAVLELSGMKQEATPEGEA